MSASPHLSRRSEGKGRRWRVRRRRRRQWGGWLKAAAGVSNVCGEGEGGAEEWGGLSLAVTWNSCFSAARWRWILAHFLPVPPLYLCCQFTVFGGPESHSFPWERRKINATAAINPLRWRIVAHKRSQSCKCLPPDFVFLFFFFLSCWETLARAGAFLRKIAPSGWHCVSEVAVLTLQVWHWVSESC